MEERACKGKRQTVVVFAVGCAAAHVSNTERHCNHSMTPNVVVKHVAAPDFIGSYHVGEGICHL
jgi:hypothetical protein